MKATGIVRRIDDLGRVVIPKEIRRSLRFERETPLKSSLEMITAFASRDILRWVLCLKRR